MKKIKYLIFCVCSFLIIFFMGSAPVYAAQAPLDGWIQRSVEEHISRGELPSWHRDLLEDKGYQAYYFKECYLSSEFSKFRMLSKSEVLRNSQWYDNFTTNTWEILFKNLDISVEYLEPDKYLGLYWDPLLGADKKDGYLYLLWTSRYIPSEYLNILELLEGNQKYPLYYQSSKPEKVSFNFLETSSYDFKDFNLSIHATPIGGFWRGEKFGVPLKKVYNFRGFKYGIDENRLGHKSDRFNLCKGEVKEYIQFDLGLNPKQDGKNAMQLVTHSYEIIKDCEAQSYFDLNFGGYMHNVCFNTTIEIDKIYRVDVAYKVTNEDKPWYDFFLPSEEHAIQKSLTCRRVSGGFFGLSKYQGYEEGDFASTNSNSKHFKHRLLLDYDADAWNWFSGKDVQEASYRKISNFQILRMNYLADGKVYDVAIKMDTVDGDTLIPIDPDLIIDTNTPYYDFKKAFDDFFREAKAKFETYKPLIYTVAGIAATSVLAYFIFKLVLYFKLLFINNGRNDPGN